MSDDGDKAVLTRRLDALRDAIEARSWEDVEWIYAQVRSSTERMMGTRGRLTDLAREWTERPGILADMIAVPGDEMGFEVIREEEATLRDGVGTTISAEAMDSLHWRMSAFVGSRIIREEQRTGLMPQKVEVIVHVNLDTQRLGEHGVPGYLRRKALAELNGREVVEIFTTANDVIVRIERDPDNANLYRLVDDETGEEYQP